MVGGILARLLHRQCGGGRPQKSTVDLLTEDQDSGAVQAILRVRHLVEKADEHFWLDARKLRRSL